MLKQVSRKIILKFQLVYRRIKYRKNSFSQKINLNWSEVHFNRISVVNRCLSRTAGDDYLEIGCRGNTLFDSVSSINKVGVDPASGGTHKMTSDQFFEKNKKKFDVIFIDGLHEYHQARRDVINSISALKDGGFIALHDMVPLNWLEEHMPCMNKFWSGDVWKLGFELSKTNGLDFKIILTDHGVGIIKVHSENVILEDYRDELSEKRFDYFYKIFPKLPTMTINEVIPWIDGES
jgi:SAM-dependent methyltransferase